jgi:hypothetical protein
MIDLSRSPQYLDYQRQAGGPRRTASEATGRAAGRPAGRIMAGFL